MTNARRPGSYADTFHVAPGMPAGTLGCVRIKSHGAGLPLDVSTGPAHRHRQGPLNHIAGDSGGLVLAGSSPGRIGPGWGCAKMGPKKWHNRPLSGPKWQLNAFGQKTRISLIPLAFMGFWESEPGGTRTRDHKLKRLVLCHLSYWPVRAAHIGQWPAKGKAVNEGQATIPNPMRFGCRALRCGLAARWRARVLGIIYYPWLFSAAVPSWGPTLFADRSSGWRD